MTQERTFGGTGVSTAAACRRRTSLKPRVSSTTRETPETWIDSFFKAVKTTVLLRRLSAVPVPTRYAISEAQPAHG